MADDHLSDESQQEVLSVSQLTAQVKDLLEDGFPSVWVAGEISNFARPQSGHCYLTLKDAAAQMRAVVWRGVASRLSVELHDGLEVICHGSLDLYAPRGSYQLVIDQVHAKGVGALELALRKLRDKLAKEGLFDPDHKRPLPKFPRRIAFVTSPTGAAIRDFLEVLRRRWQGADVLIVPTRVQGVGAAEEIAEGIRQVNSLAIPVDVLVVGRGGGSLEDLWAFNEESVVRAIFASRIPVVSAVGHEIDVTLADLVADVRALTPSEAAELVVPDVAQQRDRLEQLKQRLITALRSRALAARARLDAVSASRSLRKPHERIRDLMRRLDELDLRSARAVRQRLDVARHGIEGATGRLESLSPLNVLARGYSLTQRDDGSLVDNAATLNLGDKMVTRYAMGSSTSRVESVDAQ